MKRRTKKLIINLLMQVAAMLIAFAGIVFALWLKTIIPWQFAAAIVFITVSVVLGFACPIF